MPIKTIIFDIGRTLVPFSFSPLLPALGERRPEAEALFLRLERGALSAAAFRDELCELIGMPVAQFLPWWRSIFELRWLIPPEWIMGLHGSYRLGLLSNTNGWHFDYLCEAMPLLREFDFHILSHEAGAVKPEARIYAAAEAAAGCAPGEIFYVDDIAEFVEAARRRGWSGAVFSVPEALRRELGAAGVGQRLLGATGAPELARAKRVARRNRAGARAH